MVRHIIFSFFIVSSLAVSSAHSKDWDNQQYDKTSNLLFTTGVLLATNYFKISHKGKIVDLCCRTGRFTRWLKKNIVPKGHVTGIDYRQNMIDQANRKLSKKDKKKLTFQLQDIRNLNFTKKLDGAISIDDLDLIETSEDMKRVIDGIAKNLKSGGKFIALFGLYDAQRYPNSEHCITKEIIESEEWEQYYSNEFEKKKALTIQDYRKLLNAADFDNPLIMIKSVLAQEVSHEELIHTLFKTPFGRVIPQSCREEFATMILSKFRELGLQNEDGTFKQEINYGVIIATKR